MNAKRILLVDEHPLVRAGIRAMLDGDYNICGEAEDGEQAVEMAQSLKPDCAYGRAHAGNRRP